MTSLTAQFTEAEGLAALKTIAERIGLHAEPGGDGVILTDALGSYLVRSRACGHCGHDVTRHLPDGRCRDCPPLPLTAGCAMFEFMPVR